MTPAHAAHEDLVATLSDDATRAAYKTPLDTYRPSLVARTIAKLLVASGTLLYGARPSYLKFRAIEVIARVPYHSWSSALFTLMTLCYTDERRALRLSERIRFAHFAAENETMHVVVISAIARARERAGFLRYTLIPVLFAFVYFWFSYLLYLMNPRWSLEINYLFEAHAYEQYDRFLREQSAALRTQPIASEYLAWYGRNPRSEYEFFELVRNDELVHRNQSIHALSKTS